MDFDELGGACAHPECGKRDFLPTTCSACKKTYCSIHFKYWQHDCPMWSQVQAQTRRSFPCPLCGDPIALVTLTSTNGIKRLNPDEAWNTHFASGKCKGGTKKKKKKKKKRCEMKGCVTELNLTNKTKCPKCGIWTCLTHRFPEAHNCTGRIQSNGDRIRQQRLAVLENKRPKKKKSKISNSTDRRTNQLTSITNHSAANPSSSTTSSTAWSCVLCGSRFHSEAALAAHFRAVHDHTTNTKNISSSTGGSSILCQTISNANNTGSRLSQQQLQQRSEQLRTQSGGNNPNRRNEICPQCNRTFPTVNALIEHVESAHGEGNSSSSTRTSGSKKEECVVA